MAPYSAVVLGGGISGLTAAYYLARMGRRVALIEASTRLGGWLRTIRHGDGIIYEEGPRSIRPMGPSARSTCLLIEDLELEHRLMHVLQSAPAAKNRLILLNKELVAIPTGLKGILLPSRPFGTPLAALGAAEMLKRNGAKNLEDDTVYNFVKRRFGEKVAENGMDPLVRGITAGDCRDVSIRSLMEPMFLAEKRYGSVLKGLVAMKRNEPPEPDRSSSEWSKVFATARKRGWATYSFENGIESLTEALADQLRRMDVKIYVASPVKALSFDASRGNTAIVDIGFAKIEASHVVATIPAYALAPMLKPTIASDFLSSIPFVDVGVVNLEFKGDVLPKQAFGYLVPSHQTYSKALGVTFDTCCFPQKDRTILTCMMGGKWFEDLFGANPDPEDLLKVALAEVSERLGVKKAPERFHVAISRKCIPQHVVGHKAGMEKLRLEISEKNLPLTLTGASYDGAAINDCVHHAKRSVMSLNLG